MAAVPLGGIVAPENVAATAPPTADYQPLCASSPATPTARIRESATPACGCRKYRPSP